MASSSATGKFYTEKTVERLACELLVKYQRLFAEPLQPPVPVERIVEDCLQLNLLWEVMQEDDGDEVILAGLAPRTKTIVFNEARRAVFEETPGLYYTVLAHEAGHWELHADKALAAQLSLHGMDAGFQCLYRSEGIGDTWDERNAHRFMSHLLMPADLLLPAAKGLNLLKWRDLYRLRDLFGVTISALLVRLRRLGLATADSDRSGKPIYATTTTTRLM